MNVVLKDADVAGGCRALCASDEQKYAGSCLWRFRADLKKTLHGCLFCTTH